MGNEESKGPIYNELEIAKQAMLKKDEEQIKESLQRLQLAVDQTEEKIKIKQREADMIE
jgi:hypothetical protein